MMVREACVLLTFIGTPGLAYSTSTAPSTRLRMTGSVAPDGLCGSSPALISMMSASCAFSTWRGISSDDHSHPSISTPSRGQLSAWSRSTRSPLNRPSNASR